MSVLINGTNGLIQAYDYQTPATGFTYTFAAGTQTLVMNPAATLANGTITMPAAPSDGMTITISTTKQITSLILNGNTGQTIVGGVNSLAPNQVVAFVYRAANTSWFPMSTQVAQGNGPAFSAYQSSPQTISSATFTKVQFQSEEFDTANCYDNSTNYRFTPNVAGYYQISGGIQLSSSVSQIIVGVYKNGVISKYLISTNTASVSAGYGSTLLYLNGSTDYVELYTYIYIGQALVALSIGTYFSGAMVRAA